jgi:hypothetical protein
MNSSSANENTAGKILAAPLELCFIATPNNV